MISERKAAMSQRNHRSSLFLLELILVIFFFSLASVVCIQLFVKAHLTEQETKALNHAIPLAESAAEAFHSVSGNLERLAELFPEGHLNEAGSSFRIFYDADWHPVKSGEYVYTLAVVSAMDEGSAAGEKRSAKAEHTLAQAAVRISREDEIIYELVAAVQIPRVVPES